MITIRKIPAGLVALCVVLGLTLSVGLVSADESGQGPVKAADVMGVRIDEGAQSVRVEIAARGAYTHQATRLDNPDRFVVDVVGAILRGDSTPLVGQGDLVSRVRVSQFSLNPRPVTRVVVDLVGGAQAQVVSTEGGLTVQVSAEGTEMPQASLPQAEYRPDLATGLEVDGWQTADDQPRVAQPVRRETDAGYARTFTVNVQGADIRTVLRSIADFSGTNVITAPEVEGPVTVALTDVPWREALEVILRANGFGYVEEHGVIRVDTMEKLREEAIAQKTAEQRIDQIEQLTTRVIRIDFANADEVRDAVKNMVSSRGSVEVEPRTNSLVVNDIPSVVEMVAELTRSLDTRTPQVHIDAMLLDLDTRASRELGIEWGVSNVKPDGANFSGDYTQNTGLQEPLGQFRIGSVQDWGNFQMSLQALERENKASIISNPNITTTDNREAEILVGQKIPLIVADEAGNAVTQLTTIGIRLIVTPHINSDRQITLDVHPEVSDLSSEATVQGGVIINTSEADTRVLVNNGETAVIAGLIRDVESRLQAGVPVLKDLPLLGALFRSESKNKSKRELIVFITPSIVDEDGDMIDQRQENIFRDLQERKAQEEAQGFGR